MELPRDHPVLQRRAPARVVLMDAKERELWSVGGSMVRPLVAQSN